MLSFVTIARVAVASSLVAPAMAKLSTNILFSDGLSPHVDSSFRANLPSPTAPRVEPWDGGWIPEGCADHARDNKVKPSDMEVFNVYYTDCGSPWIFCRHRDAELSQSSMVDFFGRLPVHMRQWVRYLIAVPQSGGCSAYANGMEIVIQGGCNEVSVFVHEVMHNMDAGANHTSGSAEFINALGPDNCVPDDYANNNQAENFAQIGVLSLFEVVTPGGLDVASDKWRCLEPQKNVLDAAIRADLALGGTCRFRYADTATVATNARARRTPRGPVPSPPGLPLLQLDPSVHVYRDTF